MPAVSFVVVTHNREKRLRVTLSQLLPEATGQKVIVCDNASIDGTRDHLIQLASEYPNLVYRRNAINVGYARNLFSGFLGVRGSHVVFLADDDEIPRGFVSEISTLIDTYPSAPIIIPARRRLTGNGTIFSTSIEKTEYLPPSADAIHWAFTNSGAIPGITVRVDAVQSTDWKLDGTIYPQILLAANLAMRGGIVKAAMKNSIICGDDDSIRVRIKDAMKRPSDYGVVERASIADALGSAPGSPITNHDQLKAPLWGWALDVFREMQRDGLGRYGAEVYLESLFAARLRGERIPLSDMVPDSGKRLGLCRCERPRRAEALGKELSFHRSCGIVLCANEIKKIVNSYVNGRLQRLEPVMAGLELPSGLSPLPTSLWGMFCVWLIGSMGCRLFPPAANMSPAPWPQPSFTMAYADQMAHFAAGDRANSPPDR